MIRAHGGRSTTEHGGAVAELAVITPLVVLLVVGATDFARAYYTSIALNSAAYAGASYATYATANTGNEDAIEAKVNENLSGSYVAGDVSVDVERRCYCSEDRTGEIECSDTCVGANPTPATYVDVRVATAFETVIDWPGIPDSLTLRGAAELRAS